MHIYTWWVGGRVGGSSLKVTINWGCVCAHNFLTHILGRGRLLFSAKVSGGWCVEGVERSVYKLFDHILMERDEVGVVCWVACYCNRAIFLTFCLYTNLPHSLTLLPGYMWKSIPPPFPSPRMSVGKHPTSIWPPKQFNHRLAFQLFPSKRVIF